MRLPLPRSGRDPGRLLIAATYIAVNLIAISVSIAFGPDVGDWALWASLPEKLGTDRVYRPEVGPPFVWSPVAAWIMAGVTIIGYWPWVAAHFLALPLMRSPGLILLTATSWAFWWDAASAHAMTFVLVSGVLALRGSRSGSLSYLFLFLLMPRPIQLPLAIWLLWKQPHVRRPFAAIFAIHAVLVMASGAVSLWATAAIDFASSAGLGIGPAHYLGTVWLIIGLPLAALFFWRGWPGWSGLMLSLYVLPQYLLLPLADLAHPREGWDRLSKSRTMEHQLRRRTSSGHRRDSREAE